MQKNYFLLNSVWAPVKAVVCRVQYSMYIVHILHIAQYAENFSQVWRVGEGGEIAREKKLEEQPRLDFIILVNTTEAKG
jgi:hypothetical protein